MNRLEAFVEEVAESVCEYNIGSMQKGESVKYDRTSDNDLLYLLDQVRGLRPGQALVVVRGEGR